MTNKPMFLKEDLIKSKRFSDRKDVLATILEDKKLYSSDDVEKLISNFLAKKEVK